VNGYPDLYAYFDRELIYPPAATRDSTQGIVTVLFSINAQGKADDIRIENSLGKEFDDEVFRVIRNMPLWKPAYYNGKIVKSKVSLPLTFKLTKVSSPK
jgi:periplasmic protein TonB